MSAVSRGDAGMIGVAIIGDAVGGGVVGEISVMPSPPLRTEATGSDSSVLAVIFLV